MSAPPDPNEPQWRLQRPGAGAEQMFHDDPEMLAMVRKARAEPDPVQKPWWWIALQLLSGLAGAAITTFAMVALGYGLVPHPLVPLAGLVGGFAVFMAIVGHRPGTFRVVDTDQRLTLWKPMSGGLRAGIAALGVAFAVVGPLLVMLDTPEQRPAPAQHRGRGRR